MTTLTTPLQPLGPGHTLWPVVGCQSGLSTEVGGAAIACSSRTAGGLQGAAYHPPALLWALLMLSSSLLAPCLTGSLKSSGLSPHLCVWGGGVA